MRGLPPRFLVSDQTSMGYSNCEALSLSPAWKRVKSLWATWAYGELCRRYPNTPFLFHGLSNLNLPLKKKSSKHTFFLTIHDGIPLLAPHSVSLSIALQSRLLFPRVVSLADRIICVSKWTQDWLSLAYPEAASKCITIPNGFPTWRAPIFFERSETKLRILVVSRFEKYKQFDLLAKILENKPEFFSVTVVSDRKGVAFLEEKLGHSRINLTLLSAVQEPLLLELYESADVLLHTSRFEGFCLPASEALSNGVPVVYCRGSGIDEVVGAAVGVGLEATAPIEAWIGALEAWGKKRRTPLFQSDCSAYVNNQLQWSQVADLLLQEYRSFAFS